MSGWQPIETAPRDGTEILIATGSYRGGVVVVSWYGTAHGQDVHNCFADWDGDSYLDATHWMPLPDPPSEDAG